MTYFLPHTTWTWKRLTSATNSILSNSRQTTTRVFLSIPRSRSFHITSRLRLNNSTMEVQLTAPNGKTWTQPLGLFINNEFVPSSNGQKITTINPTFVLPIPAHS